MAVVHLNIHSHSFPLNLTINRDLSSHITPNSHAEALKRLEVYKHWFDDVVMKPGKQITLVLIPIEEIAPRYRDKMPTGHFNPVGVPNLFLSPILKAPELTVPSMYLSLLVVLAECTDGG